MARLCDPCRARRNLLCRLNRAERPTNLTWALCEECLAARRLRERGRPSRNRYVRIHPDELVVDSLVRGYPVPGARQIDRRTAVVEMLKMRHLTRQEIAWRAGVSKRTVERAIRTSKHA